MVISLLKSILKIPTHTGEEMSLVYFLCEYLEAKSIPYKVDAKGNIMAQKGNADYMPCVVAHTDTVHPLVDDIEIREVLRFNAQSELKKSLSGFVPNSDIQTGCGGDDKAGVFICLELLEHFDNLIVFFPVSEENGCIGTSAVAEEWFINIGYCIQFDSPENNTMSLTLRGHRLFDEKGAFWNRSKEIVLNHGIVKHQHHPYTDVKVIGERFNISCLNLATGYYNLHTPSEYVVLEDVENAIHLGKKLIESLGLKKYKKTLTHSSSYC
jgi:tripeptide aminopeptidase